MGDNQAEKDKQDALYEDREPKKIIRIITVTAYMISVSFVGMTLSTYYIFLWNPPNPRLMHAHALATHSEQLTDDGPSFSRRFEERPVLPTGGSIDLLDAGLNDTDTMKHRREIVENANAILRASFERARPTGEPASSSSSVETDDALTTSASILLDSISSVDNSASPTGVSKVTKFISALLPAGGEASPEPVIITTTTAPTKWTKNLGKKQHQTPFALKHLEVPIKFDGLRKRPTKTMMTTATSSPVSLDGQETSRDGTTPPVPTIESSSSSRLLDDHNNNQNPAAAYPTRSLYKTLTTPPSRRIDSEFEAQMSSTDQPEQFPGILMQQQPANSDDYKQQQDDD
ncbi:uncharacterized protein LOC106639299 isoform X2 [Copidosoma floridanum]|uniref:uncharacterized protein LOC106639299 isoform X2 n=1 Tax=Copidosoma floridanum TaxID=29053 RepID=UPI0006C9DE52|nr:uncharacterized protein LOC106639299 isoform X2 [Copidosoma floridanum]